MLIVDSDCLSVFIHVIGSYVQWYIVVCLLLLETWVCSW